MEALLEILKNMSFSNFRFCLGDGGQAREARPTILRRVIYRLEALLEILKNVIFKFSILFGGRVEQAREARPTIFEACDIPI